MTPCEPDCEAQSIALDQHGPQGIVVAGGQLYWINMDGEVNRCALDQCAQQRELFYHDRIAKDVGNWLFALAADDERIYWARHVSPIPEVSELVACSLEGCGQQPTLLSRVSGTLGSIAVAGDRIFMTTTTGVGADTKGTVASCDKRDCASTWRELALSQPYPVGLSVYGNALYWSNRVSGQVVMCKTLSCDELPQVFADGLNDPIGLAFDGSDVYFAEVKGGRISRCPREGCLGPPETVVTGQLGPTEIAFDGDSMFWVNQSDGRGGGSVARCLKHDCSPETIARDQLSPLALVLADRRVFWLNVGLQPSLRGGSVMTAPGYCRAESAPPAPSCAP